MVPGFQQAATFFVARLLNTALEGVALAGSVWMLTRLIPRGNSRTRFAVWFCALLAIGALPFFSSSLPGSGSHFLVAGTRGGIVVPSSLASWLFAAWIVGASFFLMRVGIGLWHVRQCRKACSELDLASLDPEIAALVREFKSHRRVKLCASRTAVVPAAIGFFQPAIVFPAWLWPQLSTSEMKLILLHELAHLHRWDDWTNLSQKIVRALFFFHPAVWWIERRLTLEREMACDDMVLARMASPRAYAASLIAFAEKLHDGRALALAQALVGRIPQMSPRVAEILNENRQRDDRLRRPLLAGSAAMFALVLAAAPFAPRIISFRAHSPSATQQARASWKAGDVVDLAGARQMGGVAQRVALTSPLVPRQAISAPLHPRRAVRALHRDEAPQHQPLLLRFDAPSQDAPIRGTVVFLRNTHYDPAAPVGWTFCIWHVEQKDGNGWMESTIVVSSI